MDRHIYECKDCKYSTYKKDHYTKHLLTVKHLKNTHKNIVISKKPVIKKYICNICNKSYKDTSGLWRHNKKYHVDNSTNIFNDKITELFGDNPIFCSVLTTYLSDSSNILKMKKLHKYLP